MESYVFIIKPMLETFLKNPTKENVIELKNTIENIELNQIRNLETYIIAPLVIKLDDLPVTKSSDLKCEIINCIKITIEKSKITNLNQLKTTLIILLKQIHDFNSGLLYEDLSEEIKLAVLSCLFQTFHSTNTEVLELFYIQQNSNIIGKIAATCVDVLENDKYKKLKISAIQCLQSLFYVHNEADLNDIVLRDQVANSTFLFLPKIVAVLTKVADGEEKIGQSLIIFSIQTLGRILHIIYEDKIQRETKQYSSNDFLQLVTRNMDDFKLNENEEHSTIGSNIKNKPLDERIKIIQEMIRNDKWFAVTSRKLKPIFLRLQILQSNSNEKVRKEYTIFVVNLFKKCLINLNENADIFLESIIALSQDNDSEIRELCENILQDYQINEKISIKWESLFDQHMIKLPRIITRNDDAQQIAEFLFLKGFFKHIPKPTLFTLFSFKYNVERFVNIIVEALNLNYSSDLLNEEYFIRPSENLYNFGVLPWRKFKNISSLKAINLLQNTCEHIGASSINSIIFNFLIDFLHENQQLSNEIFLFVTFLIIGNNEIEESSYSLIELFLSELNDEKHWHLALLPDDANQVIKEPYTSWYIDRTPGLYESGYEVRVTDIDHSADLNLNSKANIVSNFDAEFNVLHTCIVLDSIGNCATITKENFKKYIFKFFHRILHKSNSTNLMVQQAGFFALNSIKSSLRYENIYQLVNDYSDYLSYHISSSLKRIELNNMGIGILAVVLQYSSLDSFNYLNNIMKTLLEELAKENNSPSCILSFLKVFNIFLCKVQKWVNTFKEDLNSNAETQDLSNMENGLLTTLKNILKRPIHDSHIEEEDFKSRESNMKEEDSKNLNLSEEIENLNKDEKTSNHPKYVYTTLDILKNILKFISSKDQMHKIIALECFISGLPILKDFEDEILPLVHLLWYPYSERFKESNPIVLNRCFSLLEILVDCSKNFLQRRILKDIIPFLNEFLRKSLKNSLKNKNLTSTQEHKLQIKLLKSYGKILTDMEIQHEHLEEITDIVILYLNNNQPNILQECAVLYLVHISKYNKPLLYMKLMYYKKNESLKDNICKILSNIGLCYNINKEI